MELKARVWRTDTEIGDLAHELSRRIYLRETPDHKEMWRDATETEEKLLYEIFRPALATLNYYHSAIGDHQAGLDDGVVNMAELCALYKLPQANSYISVYCPLREVLRNWERK